MTGELTSERSLAEKLDRLFRTIHPRGRREYTFEDVAEGIGRQGGPTISATYLWQLRKGLRDNPTKKHLEAIAGFFGVPVTYFFDEEAATVVDAQLDLLTALRDASVRHLALRAFGLSAESLRAIAEIVENVRHLEGLPRDLATGQAADDAASTREGGPVTDGTRDADVRTW